MVRKLLAAFVGLAVFGMATAASAAPITRTYVFEASSFGFGAPADPITGTLILTFDPAVAETNKAADAGSIVNFGGLGSLTDGQIGFNFTPGSEAFTVGGVNFDGQANALSGTFPDFIMNFTGIGNPDITFFQINDNDSSSAFLAEETTIAQVPEPGTLAIFVMALLGLAVLAWRRREPALVRQAA